MKLPKLLTSALVVAGMAGYSFGAPEVTAGKIADGTIHIDGIMSETAWNTAASISLDKVAYGTIDNATDCKADAKILWDNQGLILGIQFRDNFHYAPHSPYLDDANNASNDDGIDIIIEPNYSQAISGLNYLGGTGQLGIRLVKGFGNGDPNLQYGGLWSEKFNNWYTENLNVADQQAKGWTSVFTTFNGLDYTYEARIAWNSEIMSYMGIPTSNSAIAMNLFANDNDGYFACEGVLSWTGFEWYGGPNLTVERWGKVTLAGSTTTIPDPIPPVVTPADTLPTSGSADISIDGMINEGAWNNAVILPLNNIVYGQVEGNADCKAEARLLSTKEGLYIGVNFTDNVHNALYSQYLEVANEGYKDDGLQIMVNGWSLVKGFGNQNPSAQYGGMWGNKNNNWYTEPWTVTEQQAKGWTSVFTTVNGVDYQYEAFFPANGTILCAKGTSTSVGEGILRILVNDNDGGFDIEGQLSGEIALTTLNQNAYFVPSSGWNNDTTVAIDDPNTGTTVEIKGTNPTEGTVGIEESNSAICNGNLTAVKVISVELSSALASAMQYAVLTIQYKNSDVVGLDEASLSISYLNGSKWEKVGGTVDTANNTIYVLVTHFSTYGLFGTQKTTGVSPLASKAIASTSLNASAVKGLAKVTFSLKNSGDISLNIFNIQGELIKRLASGKYEQGQYQLTWNGMDQQNHPVRSGVYILQLNAGQQKLTQKVSLIK